jgi:hypothetical protein
VSDKALNLWLKQLKETGSVMKQKSSDWPGRWGKKVECIRQSCVRMPKKSVAHQSLELGIPKTTIQNYMLSFIFRQTQYTY